MNLYKFNKEAAFFKPFEWLWYDNDDTVANNFKTMCPLFWAIIASVLFLPIILSLRGLGSDTVADWFDARKAKRKVKLMKKFSIALNDFLVTQTRSNLTKLNKVVICLEGRHAKDSINYYTRSNIERLYVNDGLRLVDVDYQYRGAIQKLENKEYEAYKVKKGKLYKVSTGVKQIVTNKISTSIGFLIMVSLVMYCLYNVFIYASAITINWVTVGVVVSVAVGLISFGVFIVVFIIPLMANCTWGGSIINGIGYGILYILCGIKDLSLMFISMCYNIYKKQCPIITWEEGVEPDKVAAD